MSSNDAVIVTANCVLVNRAVMLSSGQRLSDDRSVSLCWRDTVCDGWRGCWSVVSHRHWTCEGVISVVRFLCRFPGCIFSVICSMLLYTHTNTRTHACVYTVKRLDCDYGSPKHISYIIINSLYSPKHSGASWSLFPQKII